MHPFLERLMEEARADTRRGRRHRRRSARDGATLGQVVDDRRTPQADLLQHPVVELGQSLQELLEAPGLHPVVAAPVLEQRPDVHRHHGGLVGPLLGELAPPVGELVQPRAVVGAEAGERHQMVGRDEDVDEVDLQQAEAVDQPAKVADVDAARRAPLTQRAGAASIDAIAEKSQRLWWWILLVVLFLSLGETLLANRTYR